LCPTPQKGIIKVISGEVDIIMKKMEEKENKKNLLPWIIAIPGAIVSLIGAVVFFVLRKKRKG